MENRFEWRSRTRAAGPKERSVLVSVAAVVVMFPCRPRPERHVGAASIGPCPGVLRLLLGHRNGVARRLKGGGKIKARNQAICRALASILGWTLP